MPQYAPYGNAIYGITAYGSPPPVSVQTTMTVSPIPTSGTPNIGLYDSLYLNWILPGGNWNQLILVRSSFAVPSSPFGNDGVQLLYQGQAATPQSTVSTSFTDTGLQTGRFYYYALFVYDTDVNEWLMAASAQGLCLTDYGFENLFVAWTPDWYMEQDQLLVPANPLRRFFGLIGFEMNWVRSEIETLFTLNSPEYISGSMLPFLGGNVGIDYEPALGMGLSRNLVSQAVELYKTKGTSPGVQGAASAYSGYGCTLTMSPNLEIQLDDATADRSTGHWVAYNSGTTIQQAVAATYGATPQHANYLPIQGNTGLSTGLLTQVGATGYLPVNNEDVLLVSAQSAFSWTQQPQNSTIPPAVTSAATAYDASNGTTVLFGGSASITGSGTPNNQTWIFNGKYWTEVFPATIPPARWRHAMAYASASGTVIMFGGESAAGGQLGDTWSWNGTNWTQLTSVHVPPARIEHAMATNPPSGQVMVFGGIHSIQLLNDTWAWTGTDWVQQTPVHSPSARASCAMAYDSFDQATPSLGNGQVVMFGGLGGGPPSQALSDTWLWNGTDWSNPTTVKTPPARSVHSMGYNIARDTVLLFGGSPGLGASLGDTWQWAGTGSGATATWQQINNSQNNPPSRYGAVLSYDPLGTMVLFGGYSDGVGVYDDTWLYNGTTSQWTQIEGSQTPLPRSAAAVTYDTATSNVLLFGGVGSAGTVFNSTWQWSSANGWSQLTPIGNPPALQGGSMAYTTGGNVILFGGLTSGNTYSNQTWSWNGTTWSQVTPLGPPSARYLHQVVYDASLGKVILFGGFNSTGNQNDTWYYTVGSNTWAVQSPSSAPPNRSNFGFVYTTGGVSTLFGGSSAGGALSDTWQFSSGTGQWARLTPMASPPARYSHAMVYNAALSAVFVFTGYGNSGALTDSWEFVSGNWTQVSFGSPNPYPRTASAAVYYPTTQTAFIFGGNNSGVLGDTWLGGVQGSGIYISECDSTNAVNLGIPVVPGTSYVLQGYWQPVPAATPTLEGFTAQLDWYSSNGSLISSSVGSVVQEVAGQWVRPIVAAAAPAGSAYVGRTFKSVNQSMSGDLHLFDAVQLEASTSPSTWTPPRDLWLNLFPYARNLVVNGQGILGTTGFDNASSGCVITAVKTGPTGSPTWPAEVSAGFSVTTVFQFSQNQWFFETAFSGASELPVNAGQAYSASIWVWYGNVGYNLNNNFNITINWYAGTTLGSFISNTSGPGVSGITIGQANGGWLQTVCLDAIAPAGAKYAQIEATGQCNAGQTVYVAAPCFSPGLNTTYFDGLFSPSPDYAFDGTPNLSPTSWYPNVLTRLDRLIEVMPNYIPIGSTFSIYTHANAWANVGLH